MGRGRPARRDHRPSDAAELRTDPVGLVLVAVKSRAGPCGQASSISGMRDRGSPLSRGVACRLRSWAIKTCLDSIDDMLHDAVAEQSFTCDAVYNTEDVGSETIEIGADGQRFLLGLTVDDLSRFATVSREVVRGP